MDQRRWMFDELRHAGSEHLDPSYVAAYDRKAAFDPSEDVDLLRDLGLGHDSTVVDIGTGTGTFALAVAPLCKRVVATDVSPPMIEHLASRADELHIDNVQPVLAGFLTYAHRGEPADFVYCRNSLHHLPDLWKAVAIQRIADTLRSGGVLRLRDLVYSFGVDEFDTAIEAWLDSASDDPDTGWTRAELETHVRDEHSTFNWLLEPMLERSGFSIEHAAHSAPPIYSAYTCRKR